MKEGAEQGEANHHDWAALVAAALVSAVIVATTFSGVPLNFEELALDREAHSYYARVDGNFIHCGGLENAEECQTAAARGQRPAAVWLGNSQLHAINAKRPGQETAPPI
jgi:hypothetical protein